MSSYFKFFCNVDGFPPDLAHNRFKGIAIDIFTNVLARFAESSMLTLDMLKDAIKGFEYCELDKQNRLQEFKVISLTRYQRNCMWNKEINLTHSTNDRKT